MCNFFSSRVVGEGDLDFSRDEDFCCCGLNVPREVEIKI